MTERREFLARTMGRLLREIAVRTEERVAPRRWFRPPGAVPEVAFVAACTRCGDCIDVCPVHAIVKAPATAGLAASTPYIDPAMHDVKGTLIGEFKDDRWHVRYSVPTTGGKVAVIWANDLWTDAGAYTLFGRP